MKEFLVFFVGPLVLLLGWVHGLGPGREVLELSVLGPAHFMLVFTGSDFELTFANHSKPNLGTRDPTQIVQCEPTASWP